MTPFSPPNSEMSRVCRRSESMPTMHEEPACGDPVVEHLVERALHALHVHRAQPEHDEAQVAHARVGHQLLHVRLDHRDERAVDDADDRQHGR